jgi:hypothetical protein
MQNLNKKHQARIINAIQQYGGIENIPGTFWQELKKEIDEQASVVLLIVFIAAYEETEDDLGFSVDETRIEAAGGSFIKARTDQLATEYVNHTRDRIIEISHEMRVKQVPFEEQLREIRKSLDQIIGDMRAENVAITETTNAISGGQRSGASDFQKDNAEYTVEEAWITAEDDRVCDVCGPLHGTLEPFWGQYFPGGPPAHPRCRCGIETRKVPRKENEK